MYRGKKLVNVWIGHDPVPLFICDFFGEVSMCCYLYGHRTLFDMSVLRFFQHPQAGTYPSPPSLSP